MIHILQINTGGTTPGSIVSIKQLSKSASADDSSDAPGFRRVSDGQTPS
jgi:hypothetical protein